MNFDFLPGSSREFSKQGADARLAARARANGPRLEQHHRQVVAQILVAVFLLVALILVGQQWAGRARVVTMIQGHQRVFEGRVVPGATVLDVLNAAVLAGDIDLRFSIDREREQTFIWAFDGYQSRSRPVNIRVSVNEKVVDSADMHRAPVDSGDTVAVHVMER